MNREEFAGKFEQTIKGYSAIELSYSEKEFVRGKMYDVVEEEGLFESLTEDTIKLMFIGYAAGMHNQFHKELQERNREFYAKFSRRVEPENQD